MAGIRVSAPGKVILHGEHAVVYGKTAIAVSVGLRTTMDIEAVTEHVILLMPDLNKSYSWPTEQLQSLALLINIPSHQSPQPAPPEVLTKIRQFLTNSVSVDPDNGVISFLYLYISLLPHCPPLSAKITSDIPIGAGLGSSAAMSVCFASGLLLYGRNVNGIDLTNGNEMIDDNKNVNPSMEKLGSQHDLSTKEMELICSWAFMSEKIMHGTPSGIDNSVSTYGGVVTFCSGSMTPQSDLSGLDILLTNTCVGRNTRQLVAAVKERYDMFPKVVEPIMEAVDKLSLAALNTLQGCRVKKFSDCSTEFSQLESLVDMNQGLLASLGVSHPSLEKVIQITAAYGLHTKLTGAGGGGVAFSLVTPGTDKNKVEKAKCDLELSGFKCYTASIGGAGVMAWDLQSI
eukprot:TRINITY_DN4641_c0_g1_i4.p1 TRINITY_DN4641_c0_g1~~TRINITY_DN4641_c0_g1_i4.p1  ORF type:complete len:401 (+),score=96.87 TRINITY_DN4641_c0_g1_i4:50-1252(+)